MPRSQQPGPSATQTRERLLSATERLVVRDGVVSLSVRRIAAAAGVNSALIRYHFGDTDGLLRELAMRNAAQIRDARAALLEALDALPGPDFDAAVDALVLPLWAPAAMSNGFRAIIVLDEIFARASEALHEQIWLEFYDGVRRVSAALRAATGCTDETAMAWRIRFVTAAALDIPPRSTRTREHPHSPFYGRDTHEERLARFRDFARQALRTI